MFIKRMGNHQLIVGKFDTADHKVIYTRNYFNLLCCVFGYGFAVLKHIN